MDDRGPEVRGQRARRLKAGPHNSVDAQRRKRARPLLAIGVAAESHEQLVALGQLTVHAQRHLVLTGTRRSGCSPTCCSDRSAAGCIAGRTAAAGAIRFRGMTLPANGVARVADGRERVVDRRESLEVALALGRRRHDRDVDRARLAPLSFVAREEERPAPAVVQPGITTGPPSVPPN